MTTNARLRAFVGVADSGSVRAAARLLYVTESSVSAAVAALVRDVGVPLLEREGRGVRLTPAGERFAEYARTILGLHDEAVAAARAESSPERGQLRLGAVTTAAERVLPADLASFRRQHPEMQIRLEVATRDQVWPLLAHHEVDLVVAGRPPDDLEASVRALRSNTLVVVGDPGTAEDFNPHRATWLLREIGSGTRSALLAVLAGSDCEPPMLTLGSTGAVVAGVVAGLGVSLVSRDAVRRELAAGRLVELPMPGTPLERPWHVVALPELTASAELFVAHLLSELSDTGGTWRRAGPRLAS